MAAVIRVVEFDIPDYNELNIPQEIITDTVARTKGLVLVTGPAGGGKSTTLACIIDEINKQRNSHIITLEDPIEYLHKNKKSIISQREQQELYRSVKSLPASIPRCYTAR